MTARREQTLIALAVLSASCATAGSSPDVSPALPAVDLAPHAEPATSASEVHETDDANETSLANDVGDALVLRIPDRRQHALSPKSGWCGETAIQEALLHVGMWASQRLVHAAGKSKHPDLYSDEIPVALTGLGVRFAFYAPKTKGFAAYRAWIRESLESDHPVLAGVKILPTEHPDWGLDHFVLVVGEGSKGLLVNTTWGKSEWDADTTTDGISFKDVYYGIRVVGLTLPAGALPARLEVVDETKDEVTVKVRCQGLAAGVPAKIEYRVRAKDVEPAWSKAIAEPASVIETTTTLAADSLARFYCEQ